MPVKQTFVVFLEVDHAFLFTLLSFQPVGGRTIQKVIQTGKVLGMYCTNLDCFVGSRFCRDLCTSGIMLKL